MRRLACAALLATACASPPPEVIVLEVERVVDLTADPGPHRVQIERGVIADVSSVEKGGSGTLSPGTFALWEQPGVPTPEQLADLLRDGVTNLVLADRPLVDSLALRSYVGTARGRGPRIFVSGPELSGSLGEGATELRYRGRVQDYAALGAELVVVDGVAGQEAVCAVVEEGERQGILVWLRARAPEALTALACAPRAVWVAPSLREPWDAAGAAEALWIVPAELDAPQGLSLARFGAQGADPAELFRNPARALHLEDALSRVAPGYVADLQLVGPASRRVFIEGVEQHPAAPWLASLFLWWAELEVQRRVPEDL